MVEIECRYLCHRTACASSSESTGVEPKKMTTCKTTVDDTSSHEASSSIVACPGVQENNTATVSKSKSDADTGSIVASPSNVPSAGE